MKNKDKVRSEKKSFRELEELREPVKFPVNKEIQVIHAVNDDDLNKKEKKNGK